MRYWIVLGLAAVTTALDQWTKYLVNSCLLLGEQYSVNSFFSLVHVRNRGAAFGFLNSPDITWQFWLFLASTCAAVCIIFFFVRAAKEKERLFFWAMGCILGGAVGNLIDRLRYRAVIDFLDFHLGDLHWPAFNIADAAICCGAFLLLLVFSRQVSQPSIKGQE